MQRIYPLLLLACTAKSETNGPGMNNGPTGPSNMMTQTVQYTFSEVTGCAPSPGLQTVIKKKGNEVALVTLANPGTTSPCVIPNKPPAMTQNYQVCYAESSSGVFTA